MDLLRLALLGLKKALLPLPASKVEGSLKGYWKQALMLILKENVRQAYVLPCPRTKTVKCWNHSPIAS